MKRNQDCNENPDYSYTRCINNWLNANDPAYINCPVPHVNCTANDLITRDTLYFYMKAASHQEILDQTGNTCQLPCNHMFHEVKETYHMKTSLLQTSRRKFRNKNSTSTGYIQLKFLNAGPFKVYEQGSSYEWSTALTDLGGTIGLYLGLSIWGIVAIFTNLFKTKN